MVEVVIKSLFLSVYIGKLYKVSHKAPTWNNKRFVQYFHSKLIEFTKILFKIICIKLWLQVSIKIQITSHGDNVDTHAIPTTHPLLTGNTSKTLLQFLYAMHEKSTVRSPKFVLGPEESWVGNIEVTWYLPAYVKITWGEGCFANTVSCSWS